MKSPTPKIAPAGSMAAEDEESVQQSNVEPEALDSEPTPDFLFGWQLHLTTFGICLGLFLVNMEVTIVSTSSLAIVNDLQSYDKLGWILTGYLITYTGFIIPWAKSSDVFGRKTCIISSLIIFIIFSGGCAAAQTINQLIICRVFQGLGAAGGFALVLLFIHGMVPKRKYPLYGSFTAATISIANLAGPLVGGALSEPRTWRWVFLLNVPAGAVAVIALTVAVPQGFPYHLKRASQPPEMSDIKSYLLPRIRRLDLFGAMILVAAALLLTTGLLEGGVQWEWNSAQSILLLTVSGLLWFAFFWWERLVTMKINWPQEPMFPWRFVRNRQLMGVLLSSLLNGLPFYIVVILIPQRLETVNGESPIASGIKLLSYTLVAAVGGIIANAMVVTIRIAPIYIMWFFAALNTIGTGLLANIPSTTTISPQMYGYAAIAGLGIGGTWSIAILYIAFVVEERDIGTGSGALVEFRILGGALGLAITAAIMENYLWRHLPSIVTPEQLRILLRNTAFINTLPLDVRSAVLKVFADGYTLQVKIAAGISALQLLTIGMIWKSPQVLVAGKGISADE
ncbi:MFS general substrate transporter [Pleomassaria siparia CBS 279.74]|uniref:MFS general substrate transporter n=1 Tax=Pleomassaria siparia CBS 279.74 TaxID=1314801 RepID=A0A6G1K1P7_9PLEO|nr:MFS general substrate transporter [Pleomassaria siparia CBS 279.74]